MVFGFFGHQRPEHFSFAKAVQGPGESNYLLSLNFAIRYLVRNVDEIASTAPGKALDRMQEVVVWKWL